MTHTKMTLTELGPALGIDPGEKVKPSDIRVKWWYLDVSPNHRIEMKGMMAEIAGISWESLTLIGFIYRQKIEILHMKLSQYFDI